MRATGRQWVQRVMDIIRHEDGSLTVPVTPGRRTADDDSEKVVVEMVKFVLRPRVACIASAVGDRVDERCWQLTLGESDVDPERFATNHSVRQNEG